MTRSQPIECADCHLTIRGLWLRLDGTGAIRGEFVTPGDGGQAFVKLVRYNGEESVTEYRHAICRPFELQATAPEPSLRRAEQLVPDTIDDVLAVFEQGPPAETKLITLLREWAEEAPIPAESRSVGDQGWQFALDTYREWAGLNLLNPAVLDASLMTLVHIRNALFANGLWHPDDSPQARIVYTMLRIFVDQRVR